jgi:hypothetical protein
MILNTGDWADSDWYAIGIGIYGSYASVWLGKVPDNDGEPGIQQP